MLINVYFPQIIGLLETVLNATLGHFEGNIILVQNVNLYALKCLFKNPIIAMRKQIEKIRSLIVQWRIQGGGAQQARAPP